ncbi:MAG: hypothetical protein Q8Q15_01900, partial [bacterium]|nr:hypothetical protein [bacterium]
QSSTPPHSSSSGTNGEKRREVGDRMTENVINGWGNKDFSAIELGGIQTGNQEIEGKTDVFDRFLTEVLSTDRVEAVVLEIEQQPPAPDSLKVTVFLPYNLDGQENLVVDRVMDLDAKFDETLIEAGLCHTALYFANTKETSFKDEEAEIREKYSDNSNVIGIFTLEQKGKSGN